MKQNKDIRITIRLTPERYESVKVRADTDQMAPTPVPEPRPTAEEWQELRQILWTMGEVLGE